VTTDRRNTDRRKDKLDVDVDRRASDRRRGDRRRAARAPLDLWVEEEKGNELYFRRTGNVSLGGIYFEQTIPHALGTAVRLRFSLPGNTALIEAQAEIVNTPTSKDGLGMGLQFRDLSEDATRALTKFLDEHAD
jgi:uncharacterized protein (TIGR02266 family)